MSAISQSLYTLLSGDATLVALLSTYRGQPAVFTARPPSNVDLPYVVTVGDVSNTPVDTKDSTFRREVIRDVACYTDATGSSAAVEAIADRVLRLLHRGTLPVVAPILNFVTVRASGPILADEEDAYGRIVTVRIVYEE